MLLQVTDRTMWLPVRRSSPEVKLCAAIGGKKFAEIDVCLAEGECEFYACADVSRYVGQEISVTGNVPDEALRGILFRPEEPGRDASFRPLIHFSPRFGWTNDPNGLVYADGVYHLYHQWNPYGTQWGNMTWGHAVSRDMVTWEDRPAAILPDEYGTVYSGCGFRDEKNAAGFGRDALLFFYTAAGGRNSWSVDAGNLFTQRLAVSLDGGATLEKKGAVLPHLCAENRDPKVFWHGESGAYIMALYLDGYEYALYRSNDLLHWTQTQTLTIDGMRECPDLFRLDMEGGQGGSKWVFWSADGFYVTGDFDGYRFTPDSQVQRGYATSLPYAAQTYSGTPGRTVSVAWLRTQSDVGWRCGMLSFPAELTLRDTDGGARLCVKPARELWQRFAKACEYAPEGGELRVPADGTALVFTLRADAPGTRTVRIGGAQFELPIDGDGATVIVDRGVAEFYARGGLLYGAVETDDHELKSCAVVTGAREGDALTAYRMAGA